MPNDDDEIEFQFSVPRQSASAAFGAAISL
jgi:hypothetical protein